MLFVTNQAEKKYNCFSSLRSPNHCMGTGGLTQ